MNRNRFMSIFMVVLLLSLTVVGVAGAQADEPTCEAVSEAGTVEGTVIGVDEDEGTVDVLLEDGTCVTVTLAEGDYDHPIVALLANYFGGADLEDYEEALEALETEDGNIVSIEEQEDGTWLATLDNGDTVVIEDADDAEEIEDALDSLEVSLDVEENEDGDLVVGDIGDDIEQYHEDGIGFGVLVKLYAIAAESQEACEEDDDEGDDGGDDGGAEPTAEPTSEPTAEPTAEPTGEPGDGDDEEEPCGVTVEELIEMLQNGMSLGDLFKLYGKPALLGVGHARGDSDGDGDGEGGAGLVCHNGHTLSVSESAVPAHVAHGDDEGACDDDEGNGKND